MPAKVLARRVLSVECKDGDYRIEIPADAKLTFGPAIPQARNGKGGNWTDDPSREYALRVYQGSKENIIAVFTGVRQFREEALFNVQKKVVSEAGKTIWRNSEGGYEVSTSAKKKSKFVDVKQLTDGEVF